MVKRVSKRGDECPVARSLDVIGDWWSLLIIRDAFDGSRRFGEFQAGLGIAKGMLAARLRTLVAAGVMETVPASDGSAYLEYALTGRGGDLFQVVVALRQWGEAHLFSTGEPRSELLDKEAARPLAKMEVRASDERAVGYQETFVRKSLSS